MRMLNDTMGSAVDTAKHTVDSAKKGTEHAASVAFSDITDGIRAVTEVVSRIRSLGVDDALGWMGLSRRRHTFESVVIFGSGVLVGAGVAMLLAPMAGSDLRKALLTRLRGVEKDAEEIADKVKDAVVNAEQKVEDAAGKAKETIVGAAKDVVEGAEQKAGDLADKAKDAVDAADRKADTLADKAKDAIDAADRKAEVMSDKAKDAMAAAERRNNGTSSQGHHRHAARNQ
jgi:gas vesicle protein